MIVASRFAHGYIFFAAHLDDIENVAKRLRKETPPTSRVIPVLRESHLDEPKDEFKVDYYEEADYPESVTKVYHDTTDDPESGSQAEKGQGRKDLHGSEVYIEQLAKKIKERVLKELADEFLRMKLNKKRKERIQKSKHSNKLYSPDGKRENLIKATAVTKFIITTNKKSEKPFKVAKFTTKKSLMKRTTNTIPKRYKKIRENRMEKTPSIIQTEDFIIEKTDLGGNINDSYEYYVAPARDESIFESVEEPATSQEISYEIQTNINAKTFVGNKKSERRPKLGAILKHVNRNQVSVVFGVQSTPAGFKPKVDDTRILSDVDSDEHLRQTRKTVRPTRQRYSMSSPNYYASLPTVAERYDFDEPIPSKDRVRSI